MKYSRVSLIVAGVAIVHCGEARAQSIAPPAVDPGRIQQQFLPQRQQAAKPDLAAPEIANNVPPESAAATPLTLTSIVIDGANAYPVLAFDSLTAPLLGHQIRLLDVFILADAVTARYRRDGYILSRAIVPAQKIDGGLLHIRVVEGYVHEVNIQGPHNDLLTKYGAAIAVSHPLRREVLERYLLLMNALPGVTARAVLEPATGQTGGTDLTVIATQKPVDGYLSVDNRGSRYIGTLEGYAGIGVNNLFGLGERTSIDYGTAYPNARGHDRELDYLDIREDMPLGHDGLLLTVTAARSKANPGFTLKPLDAHTDGTSFSTILSYPVISSRAATWTVNANFSYLDAATDINDQPDLAPSYVDKIRALRVGTTYDFADRLGGHNLFDSELSQGFTVFDGSDNRLDISRAGARSDFHKLTINVSRRQELDGLLSNLGLFGAIAAQTSFGGPLFSAEQFGVGGATFGRGYEPSEITGDRGVAGKLELQYNEQLKPLGSAVQYYGFYDIGVIGNALTIAGVPRTQSLASVGGGVRFDLPLGLSGLIEVAKPLTKPVATEVIMGSQDPKKPHVYFAASKRF